MAKTTYIDVTPEEEERFYGDLQSGDRFVSSRIRPKTPITSRQKKEILLARTYLPTIKALWGAFSPAEKAAWKNVDPHSQQHGWRTFVADQTQRIKLGLPGVATPNAYHQDLVGKLLIEAPAEEIKLIQSHPSSYWVYQKVAGKKEMHEPSKVDEDFALPLSLAINYKSDLISTGAGSFAHFFASVRHLYQGQNLNHDLEINIPLSSAWATQNVVLSDVTGLAVSYNLYIHLYKVTGTLLIDNVKAEHSGSNWARDTFCQNINQDFTRGFNQILKHWSPVTLPTGASYLSVYPT